MKKLVSWDPVIVIAGKYKWKVSSIDKIDWDRVFVKWINEVKRAMKWKGFVKKHLSINISNVMYYDEGAKKASRVRIVTNKDGKKIRKVVKTEKEIK